MKDSRFASLFRTHKTIKTKSENSFSHSRPHMRVVPLIIEKLTSRFSRITAHYRHNNEIGRKAKRVWESTICASRFLRLWLSTSSMTEPRRGRLQIVDGSDPAWSGQRRHTVQPTCHWVRGRNADGVRLHAREAFVHRSGWPKEKKSPSVT